MLLLFKCLVVKCDNVRHIACPQFEGLTVKTMQEEAVKYPEVAFYLPEAKELPRVPR